MIETYRYTNADGIVVEVDVPAVHDGTSGGPVYYAPKDVRVSSLESMVPDPEVDS